MIFRKVSLERLSSPEQLDQLMQVTDPRGWLALAALGGLVIAALAWGVYGTIPTVADGAGILIRKGGVSDLVAAGSGQVEEVLVRVGDVVHKGQVVARIRQEELLHQIQDARAKQVALSAEYRDLLRYAGEQRKLKGRDLGQQRANLEHSIEASGKDVDLLHERLGAAEKLLADGLITKQTLLDTQQQWNAARDKLASQRLELDGLQLTLLDSQQQVDQQIETRRAALRDLGLQIGELNARLQENVGVVSRYDGRVLELMADRGDVVSPGTPILSLEVVSEELMAVLFVPASAGKQIRRDMEVRVTPSTVKREEYGSILGQVVWASAFPTTARGMTRLLGNEALVTKLMEQGPPIQVNVALRRDAHTPTGYRWSSSTGPTLEISSGTLAQGSVVLKEERPISLLIPQVRESLGL